MGKKMSNMENSFDDGSHLSPQNLGSSSPGRKQSKENTITVSGSLWVGRAPGLGLWATAGVVAVATWVDAHWVTEKLQPNLGF